MVKYVNENKHPIIAATTSSGDIADRIIRVNSSNVYGYYMDVRRHTDHTGTLYIQFLKKGRPGDIYAYYDVPLEIGRKLASTSSKGHYVWKYIRNRYQTAKLTGDKTLAKDRKQ